MWRRFSRRVPRSLDTLALACHHGRVMAPQPHYVPPGDVRSTPPPGSPAGQSIISRMIDWCRRRWWWGLPLALLPILVLVRAMRGRTEPSAGTSMTHEQADDARAEIDRRADAEIDAVHRAADAGRDMLRDRFGGR